MSYTIATRIIQKDPAKWFNIVERTVSYKANGGTWTVRDGEPTLRIGGGGTSGTLRFKNPEGEYFLVALGVDDNQSWCDIMPKIRQNDTGLGQHPLYYDTNYDESKVPGMHKKGMVDKTSKGTTITVKYYHEDGQNLYATITID